MIPLTLFVNSDETALFSPWIERQGDNLIWTIDVAALELRTSGHFVVSLYEKNHDTPGDGSIVSGSTINFEEAARLDIQVQGLREVVRLHFSFDENCDPGNWVQARPLTPVWYDAVRG